MDHLGTLNDETARIRVGPDNPIRPDIVFGLDTALWSKSLAEGEEAAWADLGGVGSVSRGGHSEEVEVATVWRGGLRPGAGKGYKGGEREERKGVSGECGHAHEGQSCGHGQGHESGPANGAQEGTVVGEDVSAAVIPIERERLEAELAKLPFEIYRGAWSVLSGGGGS
jgi:hypothetical protein